MKQRFGGKNWRIVQLLEKVSKNINRQLLPRRERGHWSSKGVKNDNRKEKEVDSVEKKSEHQQIRLKRVSFCTEKKEKPGPRLAGFSIDFSGRRSERKETKVETNNFWGKRTATLFRLESERETRRRPQTAGTPIVFRGKKFPPHSEKEGKLSAGKCPIKKISWTSGLSRPVCLYSLIAREGRGRNLKGNIKRKSTAS